MISKYFKIHELVPPALYKKRGEKAWLLIDSRLIEMIDKIKEKFPKGSMSINDYHWRGKRLWSGIRTSDSPYYSNSSLHSYGKAIDAVFSEYNVEEIRQYIIDNPDEFPYIKGIETNISWLHIDVRNSEEVMLFSN